MVVIAFRLAVPGYDRLTLTCLIGTGVTRNRKAASEEVSIDAMRVPSYRLDSCIERDLHVLYTYGRLPQDLGRYYRLSRTESVLVRLVVEMTVTATSSARHSTSAFPTIRLAAFERAQPVEPSKPFK